MFNFRIIARAFSQLLIVEGLCILLSAGVSYIYKEHAATSLLLSAIVNIVTGIIVYTPLHKEEKLLGNKEGYIILTGIWLLFCLFGTLPYIFSGSIKNFSDAFFETISGFTTTGATILDNVESLSHGILFWRSITQWLGGIGIIMISLSVLPVEKSINIQLSVSDFTGLTTDKINPRAKYAVKRLVIIYILFTLTETILLSFGGMNLFDAICHSFTTMSTGGFSTRNVGISAFSSPYIMIILIIFMFIAGTNMTIFYFGLKNNFKKVFGNNEFILYSIVSFFFVILISSVLYIKADTLATRPVLDGAFNVISIITTTGFYTTDYSQWGSFAVIILFFLMFFGGTSNSSSGSIKLVRHLVVFKNIRLELRRQVHPNAFLPVKLDKKIVPPNIVQNIFAFTILYMIIICVGAFVISFMGYDITTSFSTSAAMLGNIGPGLGTFGPFSNYSALPVFGKWFLAFLMLLGRLELLNVLILFTRSFYKN